MNIQGWFPLRLISLISSLSKRPSGVFSSTTVWRCSAFFMVWLSQLYMITWKDHSLDCTDLCQQSNVSAFSTLSRFVIAFLPRSNHFLISWLQSPSTVSLEPKKRKSVSTSTFSPSICREVMGLDAMILVFLMFRFKLDFALSSFTLFKRFFSSALLSAIRVVPSAYLRLLMFVGPILIPACTSSFLVMFLAYKLNRVTADSPVLLLSQSSINQLFHSGF